MCITGLAFSKRNVPLGANFSSPRIFPVKEAAQSGSSDYRGGARELGMIYIPTRSRPLDPWPSPLLKSLSLPPSFQPKYRRSGKAGRPPWQHSNTRPAIHKFVSIYARKLRGPVLSRPIVPRILQLFTSPISKEGSIEFSRMLFPTIRIINYNFYNWSNMEKYEYLSL